MNDPLSSTAGAGNLGAAPARRDSAPPTAAPPSTRTDASTRRIVVAAITIAIALAIALGLVQHIVLQGVSEASNRLDRSQDIRVELSNLESDVQAARLSASAYLRDSGQPFSASFDGANAKARGTIDRLLGLTSDSPEQRARVESVGAQAVAYIHLLAESMDRRDDERGHAPTDLQGGLEFTRLLAGIGEIARAETELLAARRQTLSDRQRSTRITLIAIDLTLFVLLLAAVAYALDARARARVSESQARSEYLFDLNPLPMFIFDKATLGFVAVNESAIRTYGYSREEFLALTVIDIRPPEDVDELRAQLAIEDDRVKRQYWRHLSRDGRLMHVRVFARDVRYDGRPARMILAEDVSEQRRNAALLNDREASLLDLARRLMRAQHEERRAIARELHDDLLQDLAAARLDLHVARARTAEDETRKRLDDLQAACARLTDRLRSEALDLHPAALDDLGLVAAIESVCDRYHEASGLAITVRADGPIPRVDDVIEVAAFRIAQQSLANAVRHSGARSVHVALSHDGQRLRVEVRDDGNGLADGALDASAGRSLGLISMRERAELTGGSFSIDSVPGRGTTVCAAFPAPAE